MCPGVDSASKNDYQDIPGGKDGRCVTVTTLPPSCAPKATRPVVGLLYLYLYWMEWVVNATPRPLYPHERSVTHYIGGWIGPRAGLDGYGKISPPPEFDPRTVQPTASRYTDCAIPSSYPQSTKIIIYFLCLTF
jgi:hypothetical protein